MFKSHVDNETNKFVMTANLSDITEEYAMQKFIDELVNSLTALWIEKYGAELLDKILPEDIEKHIKTKLAEKIL